MDMMFQILGISMLLNIVLSLVAASRIIDPVLKDGLFGIPNRYLGTPASIRLLRFRYFLPFTSLPANSDSLEPSVKVLIFGARIAGLCFLCAAVGFIVAAFMEARS
ncbi:MAG: hypothetical protein ACREVZ_08830 [Burkholderiales bacterium]